MFFRSHQPTASKATVLVISESTTFHIALTHNLLVYHHPISTTTTLKQQQRKTNNNNEKQTTTTKKTTSIVLAFFCDNCYTQEKLKTILMQSFGRKRGAFSVDIILLVMNSPSSQGF